MPVGTVYAPAVIVPCAGFAGAVEVSASVTVVKAKPAVKTDAVPVGCVLFM